MKKFKLRERVAELENRVSELEASNGTVTLRVHMREGSFLEKTVPFKGWGYGKNHTFTFPAFTHPNFHIDEITWHVDSEISKSGSYGRKMATRVYMQRESGLTITDADFVLAPGCQ